MSLFVAALWMAAQSGEAAQPVDPNASLQAALACRQVRDDDDRLRCFDQAVGRLSEAASSGELILADRRRVELAPPQEVRSRVRRAREAGYDAWVVELEDGTIWRTNEDSTIQRLPRAGESVHITRAALGNYWIQVENRRRLRVRHITD